MVKCFLCLGAQVPASSGLVWIRGPRLHQWTLCGWMTGSASKAVDRGLGGSSLSGHRCPLHPLLSLDRHLCPQRLSLWGLGFGLPRETTSRFPLAAWVAVDPCAGSAGPLVQTPARAPPTDPTGPGASSSLRIGVSAALSVQFCLASASFLPRPDACVSSFSPLLSCVTLCDRTFKCLHSHFRGL